MNSPNSSVLDRHSRNPSSPPSCSHLLLESTPKLREVDDYYSEMEPTIWKKILGPDLHYHFGDHNGDSSESVQVGLRRAVCNTYNYLPKGGRVLDAGCGWGGAASMLAQEHDCDVTGVTVSVTQATHCRELGLRVILDDLESLDLKYKFDGVLLLESLSHIRNKAKLLARLHQVTHRLVMTVNCINEKELQTYYRKVERHQGGYVVHDGNLLLITPSELESTLTQTGWRIRKFDDRRAATLPTIWFWEENLQRTFGDGPIPSSLMTLRKMTRNVRRSPEKFVRTYPLIDVVADAS